MKRFLKTLIIVSLVVLCFVGCSKTEQTDQKTNTKEKVETKKKEEPKGFVALLTDFGNIDDKSFNEASWNAIVDFTKKHEYSKDFFRSVVHDDADARLKAVDKAIEAGADVLICPGFTFASTVYEKQTQYPDVHFLLIDTEPADASGNVKSEKNTYSIIYKEEQVGYMAGYAAVMEGYRKLGFLGGMDIGPVKAFGYGYVQGAEAAAVALKLPKESVQILYKYAGGFTATEAIQKDMTAWYEAGTEVIFSCGGGILESVIKAAEIDPKRKIIGVDVDQASESENIIFSAMKGVTNSVSLALDGYVNNNKQWLEECAGKTVSLGIENDCVGLSATEGSWRMNNYTVEDYNKLYASMKASLPTISRDTLPTLVGVKVTVQK